MPDASEPARRAAAWGRVSWDARVQATLTRYVDWLVSEAIPAGGLGPAEAERLWSRHIADSLLFAGGWLGTDPPGDLLDIGSGVGLPGIPLAVVWPGCAVTLLDRSEKRAALARRAVRILGLNHVTVVVGDVRRHEPRYDLVIVRGVFPPEEALRLGGARGRPGGTLVVGLSHGASSAPTPPEGIEILTVPVGVLDSPTRLLRMAVAGV